MNMLLLYHVTRVTQKSETNAADDSFKYEMWLFVCVYVCMCVCVCVCVCAICICIFVHALESVLVCLFKTSIDVGVGV